MRLKAALQALRLQTKANWAPFKGTAGNVKIDDRTNELDGNKNIEFQHDERFQQVIA